MSFRAYIIGKLNDRELQTGFLNPTFSQNWMQGTQILFKLLNSLTNDKIITLV